MQLIQPSIGLVFWMLITFSFLFLILKKFGWPVILKALKNREEQIEKALDAAKLAKKEVEEIQLKNQEVLKEVKQERDNILREAHLTGEKLIEDARLKATAEADRIVESARQTINYEKLQAMTDLKNQVANLSIEIAEKILKEELSQKNEVDKVISEQLKEMTLN